ncbi:MAG: hypothetical protein FWG42_04150 [Clostridiales bacterium]|nr:hypothetical protein [Clostridiales bacterium]
MRKALSIILVLALSFTLVVAGSSGATATAQDWDGFKEVAINCSTVEEYDATYDVRNDLDYIGTREMSDYTVDVVFHIRNDVEENALSGFSGYYVIEDHTGYIAPARAAAASDAPFYFEVNAAGQIVGIPVGDSTNNLVNPGESVWIDYFIDYENIGCTFNEIYGFPNRIGYRTVSEYYSEMIYLAEKYPHLVKLHTMGYTWYGRPLYVLEICDKPGVEDGRAEWLHLAATHAREWPANELALNNAWWFTTEYQKYLDGKAYDPRVINVMKNVRSWVTPLHNPDGTHWDQAVGGSQRKNRRPGATPAQFGMKYFGTTSANISAGSLGAANYIGSDVNRNWAYRWGSNDGSSAWNATGENTNRGMGPGSEPENVALTGFMRNRMIGSDISGHTSGDLVIFPWSNKKGAAEVNGPMDFVALGRELSSYNQYTNYHERVIYSQSGEGQEYMYGGYRALGFTVEMGQSFKPQYLGVNSAYLTASFNDRNPNVGYRTPSVQWASATAPTTTISAPVAVLLPTTLYGDNGETWTTPQKLKTFIPTYSHSAWMTTPAFLQAELNADPDFVRGKILLCYSASNATNTNDVVLLAQRNGAVAVLFAQIATGIAADSNHGRGSAPSITTTGANPVTIPAGTIFRMHAREIWEIMVRDGMDWEGRTVENMLTLNPNSLQKPYNPFYWMWEKNAYMYVTLAETADKFAGHIVGKVSDAGGNAVPGANLNLTKDVYHTQLAEQATDRVFWDPMTHTSGYEGPATTASTANRKPDWRGVNWAQYAPWGHGVNTNTANLDPALAKIAPDIQAWFAANPPKSRYYDDICNYVNPTTGDTFRTIKELQTGYMDIQNADGTYDWSVVPSQQPETYAYEGRNQPNWTGGTAVNIRRGTAAGFEVDSASDPRIGLFIYEDEGYDIVAKAPAFYDSAVNTVFVEDYKAVKNNVNFTVSKAITTDFDFGKAWGPVGDVTVPFSTWLPDGTKGVIEGAAVTAIVGGLPAVVNSLGGGNYTATFDPTVYGTDSVDIVIDFEGGAAHSAFAGEIEFTCVYVDLSVDNVNYIINDVEYTVSLRDAVDVLAVELEFVIDGNMLAGKGLEGLNGFDAMNQVLWIYAGDNLWKGTVTLDLPSGTTTGLTAAGPVDIAVFSYTAKGYGNAVMTLTGARAVGLFGDTTKYLTTVIGDGAATSIIAKSKYDLNRDGVVDALDLGIMLLYCGFDADGADWDALVKVNDAWGNPVTASMCDVNGDGLIDMLDLLDLFIHYTK